MSSTEKVEFVATARDQASATLKRLQTNVTALGSKGRGPLGGLLSGFGGISPVAMGAAVGVGILTAALADGVSGALAEDKQLARLGATLQANVKDWDGSTAAVDRATQAAMDLAFSDDDARESMIKLITATGNVTTSVKDMRLAMDIARGRNIDLASATDIVIKANMGNVGALRRLGIEVDKGSTSLEILTELQQRYAGQAESYANTTAGKFEAAQAKVNDAMEEFGHHIVNDTAGLLGLNEALQGNQQAAADFISAVGDIDPTIKPFADWFQQQIDKLPEAVKGTLPKATEAGRQVAQAINTGMNSIQADVIREQKQLAEEAAKAFSDRLSDDLVSDLKNTKGIVQQAWKDINWALNHPGALAKKLGQIEVVLDSDKLQKLLTSDNPQLRLIGQQVQAMLTGQIQTLTGVEYQSGVTSIVGAINSLKGYLNFPGYRPPGGTQTDPNADHTPPGVIREGLPYNPPHYARGGYMGAGQWGLVGENGPEYIRAGRKGATVAPNTGGHGHTIVLNNRVVGQAVDEYLGHQLARMPNGIISRG